MKTDELAKRILLPREAYTAAVKVEISREEYVRERELFYQDVKSFLERWKGKEKRYTWALAFYLRLSAETYDKYQEEGIPDQVFDQCGFPGAHFALQQDDAVAQQRGDPGGYAGHIFFPHVAEGQGFGHDRGSCFLVYPPKGTFIFLTSLLYGAFSLGGVCQKKSPRPFA